MKPPHRQSCFLRQQKFLLLSVKALSPEVTAAPGWFRSDRCPTLLEHSTGLHWRVMELFPALGPGHGTQAKHSTLWDPTGAHTVIFPSSRGAPAAHPWDAGAAEHASSQPLQLSKVSPRLSNPWANSPNSHRQQERGWSPRTPFLGSGAAGAAVYIKPSGHWNQRGWSQRPGTFTCQNRLKILPSPLPRWKCGEEKRATGGPQGGGAGLNRERKNKKQLLTII